MNIVLDTLSLRFIIYIWYEDGDMRPSLVKLDASSLTFRLGGGYPKRRAPTSGERARRQPRVMGMSARAVSIPT